MYIRRLVVPGLLLGTAFVYVTLARAEAPVIPLCNNHAPVDDTQFEAADAKLTVHLAPADKANGAAMVICPGGGYRGLVVGAEGHGIAAWLNAHGIAGFVLEYRLPAGRRMVPLFDAQRAIRTVRARAEEFKLDPHKIGIIGFSAGGHVASTAATHFDDGDPKSSDPIARMSCRPDFALLVYPVVSMGPTAHLGSRKNLLGDNPTPELLDFYSNEKQVTAKTPPMFLTHAANDKVVVPENSRDLHAALKKAGVVTEYLELPDGGHGLNGYKGPMWDAWQTASLKWLAVNGFVPK